MRYQKYLFSAAIGAAHLTKIIFHMDEADYDCRKSTSAFFTKEFSSYQAALYQPSNNTPEQIILSLF